MADREEDREEDREGDREVDREEDREGDREGPLEIKEEKEVIKEEGKEEEKEGEKDVLFVPILFAREKEEVIVRRICKKDKEELIKLSRGVYKFGNLKLDYLERNFERWIYSSNRHLFGLQLNGKLIGFKCKTLLDDNKTVWEEAYRIDEDYRGKGFFKLFSQLEKNIFQLPSSVIRKGLTKLAMNENEVIKNQITLYPSSNFHEFRYCYLFVHVEKIYEKLEKMKIELNNNNKIENNDNAINNNNLNNNNNNNNDDKGEIEFVNAEKLYELVKGTKRFSSLIKNNTFISDWISYDFNLKNLIYLQSGALSLQERKFFVEYETNEEGEKQLKSFAMTSILLKESFDLKAIEIYANDFTSIFNHFYYQIFVAKNNYDNLGLEIPPATALWLPYHTTQSLQFQQFKSNLLSDEVIIDEKGCASYYTPIEK